MRNAEDLNWFYQFSNRVRQLVLAKYRRYVDVMYK